MYWATLFQKCTNLEHIKQIQSQMVITGQFQFCPCRSKLIELCSLPPFNDLPYALLLFRQIQSPSTNDSNAILRGLAHGPNPTRAIAWYRLATLRSPPRVDALTCSFTLKACALVLARSETLKLHAQIVRRGFVADALLGTTLLDVYAKVGDLDSAQKVFDEMPVRDIASWNALISGLGHGNRPSYALDLLKRMIVEGWKPNEVTVLGALAACAQLGAMREVEMIDEYVRDEKLNMNVQVCNAVIDTYAKCGFVDKSYLVFDNMKCRKSLVTWNTMIMSLAMHGDGHKALELFRQMGVAGVNPDAVSYLAALCACSHAGLVEDGIRLFDSMARLGVAPNVKHYGTVVDLLGRAGRLKEAYDIINSMPTVPDVVLWQSLLGACKTYNDVELAEIASQKLVEMGSNNCGDFVLLSNVYAAVERWDDVGRVREAMKDRDVKKVPGFSYIEVEGVIHKFFTSDKNHVKAREIYAKLDEIRIRVIEYGYMAETSFVLHDIAEEEKEIALRYHSEKLAVAFGLISTSEGTPIGVIKNLRICGDCHTVIKLISKIYNREIIVRDRVRFHRFTDGSCCCRDYW
ncbi:PPR domain-containing protein/PPR_2 domain-containing protein/DYW_deaminase domain-containing protein [Cephalotus follicularis]|uniref:PPR domain-containing protein/PPR_2 domain-containing protein/DYW_deaminase domain-containing protein n=1 Tax=Cephalotus follicularis TaxID=3775 RepID=A0A1Q3BZ87_CEPFO|nr:PPR domain-containing protein/PPR_2 domain-containing protein/DYW_deaminase domain-containing protein [Cephalotus follicularis]